MKGRSVEGGGVCLLWARVNSYSGKGGGFLYTWSPWR